MLAKNSRGIWATDSARQTVLQTESLSSSQVLVITELKTDHDVDKLSTRERDTWLPKMSWHAQELWKHRPASIHIWSYWSETERETWKCQILCVCSSLLNNRRLLEVLFIQSLRPTTGEQHPVTIREIKICEGEAEKSLEVFAPVQMLLLLTVVLIRRHLILYRGTTQ